MPGCGPLLALLLLSILHGAVSDLPVHCLRHQLAGHWNFFLGPASSERSSCGHSRPDAEDNQPTVALAEVSEQKEVQLLDPNIARTGTDADGRWTMIYDEGFEVNVDGLSFFAFSRFDLFHKHGVRVNVSYCGETQLGWYHDLQRSRWGCYYAQKRASPSEHALLQSHAPARPAKPASYDEPLGEEYHNSFASSLNLMQDLWTAKGHSRLINRTLREMNAMAGIFRPFSALEHRLVDPFFSGRPALSFLQKEAPQRSLLRGRASSGDLQGSELPKSWDWRNVSGVSFVDAVLDQADCGSCYAVATTRMLSARHRIKQNDPTLEAFSINFPLQCSEYNQGCNGGYAFLVSRWSQDVGLVPESCAAYMASKGTCQLQCHPGRLQKRWRADKHHYVGGYYGAATELEMMRELVTGGPLVASFEPKPDIMYYSGGIYRSSPNQRLEWERVDHAVLLVGYGEERGQKYWLLQNSWGKDWGEDGFFRMARGTDESSVESIVVSADVVEDKRPSVLLEFARTL